RHRRSAGEGCLHQSRRDRSQPRHREAGRSGRSRHGSERDGQGPEEREFRFRSRLEARLDPARFAHDWPHAQSACACAALSGADLAESVKKLQGRKLLAQIIDPSSEINEKFQNTQFVLTDGRVISGVIVKEEPAEFQVMTNLLTPEAVTRIAKSDIDQRVASKISPMPQGLANML